MRRHVEASVASGRADVAAGVSDHDHDHDHDYDHDYDHDDDHDHDDDQGRKGGRASRRRPRWIGAALAAVLLAAGCVSSFDESMFRRPDAADADVPPEVEADGDAADEADADAGDADVDADADADADGDDGGACIPEECDDDNACNGLEVCLPDGTCFQGRPPDNGTPCTNALGAAGYCFDERCRPATCGNGVANSGEERDDGNLVDGDGCESDCTFSCRLASECDDGEACNGTEDCVDHACVAGAPSPDGTSCGDRLVCRRGACVAAGCGDGVVDATAEEECDDGNDVSGDGCESDCTFSCRADADCNDLRTCNGVETCDTVAHRCAPGVNAAEGTPCRTAAGESGGCRGGICAPPGCGDSTVGGGEDCDDGNLEPGDGCENDCTWTCVGDPACDDGRFCNGAEVCDLGTHTCAAGTPPAEGTECNRDGDPTTRDICRSGTCRPSTCGDGFRDEGNGEACDDGNPVPGDGCETTCRYSCVAVPDCDDGDACNGSETCDTTMHVCLPGSRLLDGTACARPGGGAGECRSGACVAPTCGNGTPDAGEECDDGNTMAGDGCETTCRYSCHTSEQCQEVPDNPCTTDACASVPGGQACSRTSNTNPCDDGDQCTSGDVCSGGTCRGMATDADGDGYGPGVGCGGDCDDGNRAVNPGATEACNAADDDCDGATDETFACVRGSSRGCTVSGGCAGTESCLSDCSGYGLCRSTGTETCNGLDDDCDGTTDEGFACAQGSMRDCTVSGGCAGRETCSVSCVWSGTCVVTASETCNGSDDDCDTLTDEGFGCRLGATEGCTRTGATGTCSGTRTCGAGCIWGSCLVTTAETCNSVDDDCDTVIDNGFTCTPGQIGSCTVGSCAGTWTCTASCAWGACTVSATESCNGSDDDCDTLTDEGFTCRLGATEPCTTACSTAGNRACISGCVWGSCCAATETCGNSCDDDCDTLADEGCGGVISCTSDAPCTPSGLICNENWGICVVSSCAGRDDFTPCETVTSPDRSYDICVDETCVSPGCGTAACNAPGPNWPLADTNQRTCYDNLDALGSCPGGIPPDTTCDSTAFCGQDAQYGWDTTHAATERFTRTTGTEPVVTDNVTGLIWQGCSRGQTGSSCTGTATTANWDTALSYCDGLSWGGYSDWRLPDEFELQSIVDYGRSSGPRIDVTVFPATPSSYFWSSSSCAGSASIAWYVGFGNGSVNYGGKTNTFYVRCVRRGP